jgi:hypothetical protein
VPLRPLRFDGDRYKPTAENPEERREKDETTTTLPLDTGALDETIKCKTLLHQNLRGAYPLTKPLIGGSVEQFHKLNSYQGLW